MWSLPTVSTTAAVPPSSPTQLAVVGAAAQNSATLSWQLPSDCGGGRVAVYEVRGEGVRV